jgi:hypothetical protein
LEIAVARPGFVATLYRIARKVVKPNSPPSV